MDLLRKAGECSTGVISPEAFYGELHHRWFNLVQVIRWVLVQYAAITRLLLVRHGHVEGIDPVRFRGRRDLPLTAGLAQARALGDRIADSWPPRLIDIDYGAWHGLTLEEARGRWPEDLELWCKSPQLSQIPDGETLPAVLVRVARALARIVRRHPNELVILVAHESVNRVALLYVLDLPPSRYWTIDQSPCCINELEFLGDRFLVHRLNDTAHLA